MAKPGVQSPPTHFEKSSDGGTKLSLKGSKQKTVERIDFTHGQVAQVGPAPTSRVYTRDYSKVGREEDDQDLVTSVLGRDPFRL